MRPQLASEERCLGWIIQATAVGSLRWPRQRLSQKGSGGGVSYALSRLYQSGSWGSRRQATIRAELFPIDSDNGNRMQSVTVRLNATYITDFLQAQSGSAIDENDCNPPFEVLGFCQRQRSAPSKSSPLPLSGRRNRFTARWTTYLQLPSNSINLDSWIRPPSCMDGS